jgi:acyl carrier protein
MHDDIHALIHQVYGAELAGLELTNDLNLFENGIIDSFALINFVMALEAKYGLKIPDSDATPANLGSVDLAAAYIERRRS